MEKDIHRFLTKFHWQLIITGFAILALLISILFRIFSISNPDLPLLIAIIVCGIPSILEILIKLIKGDLGADSLAAIALITAVVLNQYLAGVIIILISQLGKHLKPLQSVKLHRFY